MALNLGVTIPGARGVGRSITDNHTQAASTCQLRPLPCRRIPPW